MAPKNSTVAQLAGRSHGVVTRKQLLAAGLTTDAVRARLENGSLIPVHWGVYRVGHRAPSVEATYLAAVLACGEGAALSGKAAAHLFGLVKEQALPEVTAPTFRRVRGVVTHRARRIESTTFRAVPVTTVPQVLVDLAARLSLDDLARACHEADVKYGTKPRHVQALLNRQPGATNLKAILFGDFRLTLSKLEREFLRRLQAAGLPLARTNKVASGRYVDCRWPDHRLTVELDSYTFHNSRHAWERDRAREREARARGDDFRRFTYDDVFTRWPAVEAELRAGCFRACASVPARASSTACAAP
jgi:hypothetical protein